MNRLIFLLLLLFLMPLTARAEDAGNWGRAPEIGVRLISPATATGNAASLTLGLEVELAPGWHTYWRSPGAAGLPANLDWTGSQNLKSATIRWPAPQRLMSQGLQAFGYEERVVLPLAVELADPAAPLELHATVDILACSELCVPFTFELTLSLPAGPGTASPWQETLNTWAARVPVPPPADGSFRLVGARTDGQSLTVTMDATPALTSPRLIVESKAGYQFDVPVVQQDDSRTTLVAPLMGTEKAGKPLRTDTLTLTLTDGNRHYELPVPAGWLDMDSAPPALTDSVSLLAALLAAFVGGLILNLMPCVLPVLSLKLLAIIHHAGAPRAHIRLSFLATAAGILTCFLGLAGIAIALKQAGVAFGWGVQFQHPAFIIPMLAILTLFAASLWNLIHIPLPRFLADAINDRLPLPGEHDRTLAGNFITGMFATLLATPCSAPFVGTALGFALAGSATDILLVAVAMGLGLSVPYLLVAAFPGIAHHLPRPGRWMEWLRAVFGLALLASALWLASVLRAQLDGETAFMAGGSVLLAIIVLWMRAAFRRPILFLKGLGVGLLMVLAIYGLRTTDLLGIRSYYFPLTWQAFDEAAIPALVAQGKVVLVDVTADWCLTCQANKSFVLEAEPTRTRLSGAGIVLMRADWTTRSDAIGDYLKKYGRFGIPFNIVYGPAAPQGVPLPELLTAARVESALIAAGLPPK